MTARKKPPRSWDIDDLLDIGKRGGIRHVKAIPVLLLEEWVRRDREEGVANYVRTNSLARRLVGSKLVAGFKAKGTSNVIAGLSKMQSSRNLTRPPLIEYQGGGVSWVNLPHYEPLLQEYRQLYRERYPEDYAKLFPEDEPEWEPARAPKKRPVQSEDKTAPSEPEKADEIHGLLAPLEHTLREREQVIEKLTEENQKLRAELVALQAALQEKREAPRSALSERRIADEELRNDCAELLESEKYYINAIRNAGVVLEERLRKSTGAEASEFGTRLVDYALHKDSGRLTVSEHPVEQEGVHLLFRGAVQFVRNPPMHRKLKYTEGEARGAVGLIDYLLLLLQRARLRQ
jgi:uncharacterized protein (TIGR02391 family)